jgi:hypothetical protein
MTFSFKRWHRGAFCIGVAGLLLSNGWNLTVNLGLWCFTIVYRRAPLHGQIV